MISEKLKSVIVQQLGAHDIELTDSTTADEVPGWDSLSHVAVIAAVESAFNIRFKSLEVIRLKNVGQLQALIDRKLESRV